MYNMGKAIKADIYGTTYNRGIKISIFLIVIYIIGLFHLVPLNVFDFYVIPFPLTKIIYFFIIFTIYLYIFPTNLLFLSLLVLHISVLHQLVSYNFKIIINSNYFSIRIFLIISIIFHNNFTSYFITI